MLTTKTNKIDISKDKIDISKVESAVREIIFQRADPFDEMMDYLKRLLGNRYSYAEMNRIEDRVKEIFQRVDRFNEMMDYLKNDLLKDKI